MAGTGMPLGEPSALRLRSACRQGWRRGLRLCTNRSRFRVWTAVGSGSTSGTQEKWLSRAWALVNAWQWHVHCLAPFPGCRDAQPSCWGLVTMRESGHTEESSSRDRGHSWIAGAQRELCGQDAESEARSRSFPVVGGLTEATAKAQTTNGPDSALTRN